MEHQTSKPPIEGKGLYIPADPEITFFNTGHYVQKITINEGFIMVEDPGVGDFVIQDPLMYDIYTTANVMRANAISQLCKSKQNGTIPNLADFTRLEGVIAQYRMVEEFGTAQGLDRQTINAIHIGIETADTGQFAFSHLLEQAIQKWGGPEDDHDLRWPEVAGFGGTLEVLQKHGVPIGADMRVRGIVMPRWAERPNKLDLDVDNLQYIISEGLRWFDTDIADPAVREKVKLALDLKNFEITPNGELAVKDVESALVVSKLLMLFSTEHWNDPINRAHMHLIIHGVQRSVSRRRLPWMDDIDCGETRKPIGYYYAIDDDFNQAMTTGPGRADDFIYIVGNTLNSSGMEERRRFVDYRSAEYSQFMLDDRASDYPSRYFEPKRVDFGPRPSTVETEVISLTDEQKEELAKAKVPRLDSSQDALTYVAGPLKNRFIDPLVRKGDGFVRLSEYGPGIGDAYKKLCGEHQQLQKLGVRVNFAFNPGYAEEFRQGMMENDREYESEVVSRPEMTHDQRRRIIERGANTSIRLAQAAGRLELKRELSF